MFFRHILLIATAMMLLLFMPALAWAQASSSVEVVPIVTCDDVTSHCIVPTGDLVAFLANHFMPIVLTLISLVYAWLLRSVPTGVAGVLKTFRVDQLLKQGIEYGIAMVVNATKDKKWDIALGSSIVAHVVIFAVGKMPSWMKNWIGPIDNLVDMVIARIQPFLEDGVDGSALKGEVMAKLAVPPATHLKKTSVTALSPLVAPAPIRVS